MNLLIIQRGRHWIYLQRKRRLCSIHACSLLTQITGKLTRGHAAGTSFLRNDLSLLSSRLSKNTSYNQLSSLKEYVRVKFEQMLPSTQAPILETAFKKETVGLVTREQYVEKRVNIRNKIEEEEKEKLQKLHQEEEELQLEKRKKRKIKGNARLSFSDDLDNGIEEEDEDNGSQDPRKFKHGKLGKDPTVETSFLPDSEREAEELAERERLKKQWLREQELIKNEPLEITYSYWDGTGHRRVIQVRKGDTIGEFLRGVQQQLAPEFREIRTTSVENLLYVKEDLIIPHQHSFYELIINKARGKSGPLFHFDVHEDVRTIADATIEKDESHAGKVVERHWYEKNKHIFPASRWEIYDPTKKWERYTIHGD